MNTENDPNDDPHSKLGSTVDPLLKAAFAAVEARTVGPPSSVIESLLKSIPSVPRVLLRSAAGEAPESVVQVRCDELPRGSTGRYQLHGEIARGGMGIVVRGRDADLGRDLAVKILLQCHQSRAEVVQRFVEEAQIGGQLQHPGVVPVYELGQFEDGRPFFTMKLVKGKTLAALLGERKDPADERRKLLGILEQISQTLAYAHSRGVIHRDLKPSNVMVGAFGEVQVMDWGLAKVLKEGGVDDEKKARTRHAERSVIWTVRTDGSKPGSDTLAGSVMGTPAYMAPEQARGEVELVDERADVFGLGAILCEMLTGEPPFRGSLEEAQKQARSGDVSDAMARLDRSSSDPEIVRIARACLAANPLGRPRHSGEVAAQLSRHLESVESRLRKAEVEREAEKGRAVEAEKARKEAQARALAERRAKRVTIGLGLTIVTALAAGGGGWAWLTLEQESQRTRLAGEAHTALEKVASLREQAKSSQTGGLEAWSSARVEAERAKALLEGNDVDPDLETRVRDLISELNGEERDRSLLAAIDAARLAGTVRNARGHFARDRSIPLYKAAFQVWGISTGDTPVAIAAGRLRAASPGLRGEAIGALDDWIGMRAPLEGADADPELEWLKATVAAADDDSWRKAIRESWRKNEIESGKQLAAEVDVTLQPISMLVAVASGLANVHEDAAALGLLERAWRQFPGDFWLNTELGNSALFRQKPQFDKAVLHYSVAVAVRKGSTGARVNLSNALGQARRFEEAKIELEAALQIEPGEPRLRAYLGLILCKMGKSAEGLAAIEKVLRENPDESQFHALLGDTLDDLGRHDEALGSFEQAARLAPREAEAHNRLGTALGSAGHTLEAVAAFEKAIELDPRNVEAHLNLGTTLQNLKKWDEAAVEFRKALKLYPDFSEASLGLAETLFRQGKLEEALQHARRAVELSPVHHDARHLLGKILQQKGLPEEAIEAFRAAIQLEGNSYEAYDQMGECLQVLERLAEAEDAYRKSIAINSEYSPAHIHLGFLLETIHRPGDAVTAFQAGLAGAPKHAGAVHHLGKCLLLTGQQDEGIEALRRSIALDGSSANAHFDLGMALADLKQRWIEAAAEFRIAAELVPGYAPTWANLGHCLTGAGKLAEAKVALAKSLELDSRSGKTHFYLGQVRLIGGENAEAIPAYTECVRSMPDYAEARCNLGHALMRVGRFAESLEELRKGHALGIQRPGWSYPSAEWVERAERHVKLEERLPQLVAGEQATPEEMLDAAEMCRWKGRYADSAKVLERVFAASPELAKDTKKAYRYNAACSAALGGTAKGAEAAPPGEQARLRSLALGWLREDLALVKEQASQVAPGDAGKSPRSTLKHWLEDTDFAGVRDEEGLAALPAEEAAAWRGLWKEVTAAAQ